MVEKKELWVSVRIIAVLLIVLAVGAGIFTYINKSNPDTGFDKITNVFDEMIAKEYTVMEEAEHITAGGYDAVRLYWQIKEGTPLRIGIVYSMEYKKLYIYGDACMPEEIRDMSYQEYFEKSLAEYGITWEEVEDRKEDFICKNILGQWFTGHISRFSKDRLGELEVLDFLMPYEYCGKDNSEWMTVIDTVEEGYEGAFQGKIQYIEWDAGDILCKQTQKSRDYGYHDIMERIEADMNGFNTVSEDIIVEWYHKWDSEDDDEYEYNSLVDIFELDCHYFVDWLHAEGKVEGNLTKLSYTREEGEAKTREMIKQYSSSILFRNLEAADYYITGDELHIRLAYYDYKAGNPDWVENGKGEVWQGWITVKVDDVREFLQRSDFYIERREDWKEDLTDGYLYVDYDYYDYIEKYYNVLKYSISTSPKSYYDIFYSERDDRILEEYLKEDLEREEKLSRESPGENQNSLRIDYHRYDFNDDGLDDYLVCLKGTFWDMGNLNVVKIYIQEKKDALRCAFEGYIHFHDSSMPYSHAPVAILDEKTEGYYMIALPESKDLLRYNKESEKYEYFEIEEKAVGVE